MTLDLDEVPALDEDIVTRLRTLRDQVSLSGEDVLGDLLALFQRDGALRADAIREALVTQDPEARRKAAHSLKGSAGNMGARRVALLAQHAERVDATLADVDRLECELQRAVALLSQRLR